VLSPLNVDRDLGLWPAGVEKRSMPVGPDFRWCTGRVVYHPDNLLVRRNGKRDPRPVDIVAPEQVVSNYRLRRMDDRNDPGQGEPFIPLEVQDRSKAARQHSASVSWCERALQIDGSQWDVGARPAPDGCGDEKEGPGPDALRVVASK